MMRNCGCFHHWFAKAAGLLGLLAGLLFLWTGFMSSMFWGLEYDFYFKAAVVFALMVHGTKMCKCCCNGMKCGYGDCGVCKVDGGNTDGGMCKHDAGCKCGDCGRCK